MKFRLSVPNEDFDAVRYLSHEGKWEIGVRSQIFGYRASLAQVGAEGCLIDYCAGNDRTIAVLILSVMAIILDRYPEDVPPLQLEREFPRYTYKPIYRDRCWGDLQEMAGFGRIPSIVCSECQRYSYREADVRRGVCTRCHLHKGLFLI